MKPPVESVCPATSVRSKQAKNNAKMVPVPYWEQALFFPNRERFLLLTFLS
jgi:hypothetical protein